MVRFDLSDREWANMLVGRNYRPDRLPKPVIDAECLLLGGYCCKTIFRPFRRKIDSQDDPFRQESFSNVAASILLLPKAVTGGVLQHYRGKADVPWAWLELLLLAEGVL